MVALCLPFDVLIVRKLQVFCLDSGLTRFASLDNIFHWSPLCCLMPFQAILCNVVNVRSRRADDAEAIGFMNAALLDRPVLAEVKWVSFRSFSRCELFFPISLPLCIRLCDARCLFAFSSTSPLFAGRFDSFPVCRSNSHTHTHTAYNLRSRRRYFVIIYLTDLQGTEHVWTDGADTQRRRLRVRRRTGRKKSGHTMPSYRSQRKWKNEIIGAAQRFTFAVIEITFCGYTDRRCLWKANKNFEPTRGGEGKWYGCGIFIFKRYQMPYYYIIHRERYAHFAHTNQSNSEFSINELKLSNSFFAYKSLYTFISSRSEGP